MVFKILSLEKWYIHRLTEKGKTMKLNIEIEAPTEGFGLAVAAEGECCLSVDGAFAGADCKRKRSGRWKSIELPP